MGITNATHAAGKRRHPGASSMREYIYALSLHNPEEQIISLQYFRLPLIGCAGFDVTFSMIPSGTYRARVQQVTLDGSIVEEMDTSLVVESSDSLGATVHVSVWLSTRGMGDALWIQAVHADATPYRLIFTPQAPPISAKEESLEEFSERVDQIFADVHATQEDTATGA
jgi:hypothetical protein